MSNPWKHTLEIPDPLVARYLISENLLQPSIEKLSEAALYLDYCLRLEVALLEELAAQGLFPEAWLEPARVAASQVTLDEMQAEEDRVRHDLKALINVFSRHCPPEIAPFIHLGATSYDILANAHLLRVREGVVGIVRPLLIQVAQELARLAELFAAVPQIGRTHGQYAEPMTFGYAMAVYLERLGQTILALDGAVSGLRGKFSGAVGAYTTPALIHADPVEFERRLLARVSLTPSFTSTQIAHPEPALAVLHHLMAAFGVLANLADDLRHLQRSEINEVAEGYAEKSQVGSSAMPHKRNPITWENVKSLWKVFMPQIMTFYLDQVSEHQRDLSNSASARFMPRLLMGLAVAASRTRKGLTGLTIDREVMVGRVEHLREVVSGPLQALFSLHGVADAHERVRLLTVRCRKEKRGLLELVQEDPEMASFLQRLTGAQRDALSRPEALVGPAENATHRAVEAWCARLGIGRASSTTC